jgi:hypothetical protein
LWRILEVDPRLPACAHFRSARTIGLCSATDKTHGPTHKPGSL